MLQIGIRESCILRHTYLNCDLICRNGSSTLADEHIRQVIKTEDGDLVSVSETAEAVSQEDEYIPQQDAEEMAVMARMGLPTGFVPGGGSVYDTATTAGGMKIKGEKKTYLCELCDIELNSEVNMSKYTISKERQIKFYFIGHYAQSHQRGQAPKEDPGRR